MRWTSGIVLLLCTCLCLTSSLGVVTATPSASETADPLNPPPVTVVVQQSDSQPTVAKITITAHVQKADVADFQVAVDDATVVNTTGFEKAEVQESFSGTLYKWEKGTSDATLTLHKKIPSDSHDGMAATDEWYFSETPFVQAFWYRSGDSKYSRARVLGGDPETHRQIGEVTVKNGGVVGDKFLYVGPYTEQTITNDGIAYRYVFVGNVSEGDVPAKEITQVNHRANEYLAAQDTETPLFFVVPSPMPERGEASPAADEAWVHASEQLGTPTNTWLHEYIHIQQSGIAYGEQMQWYPEAITTYQTALLSHQVGNVSKYRVQEYLERDGSSDATLASPKTWATAYVPYTKGVRVMSRLDGQVRAASNNTTTVQHIDWTVNQQDRITYTEYRSILVNESNETVGIWLDKYVKSSASPTDSDIRPLSLQTIAPEEVATPTPTTRQTTTVDSPKTHSTQPETTPATTSPPTESSESSSTGIPLFVGLLGGGLGSIVVVGATVLLVLRRL